MSRAHTQSRAHKVKMEKDLTQGKPTKLIVAFAIPLILGSIFQQLYSMVDTIIVGQTISVQALAGVGATSAISFLVIGFIQGMTAGFAILTSQKFGAKDEDGVKKTVAASIVLSAVLSVILTALSVPTARLLLEVMNTPDTIIAYADDYITTIYWGLTATVFYNMFSSLLRSVGDSKSPLWFLILASVINVGLDFLFIMVFDMGVAGAGWATTISQGVSAIACLIHIIRKYKILRINRSHMKFGTHMAGKMIILGLPMALQYSIISIGIMVQQSALNNLGDIAIAAYTAANKINNLATQVLVCIGTAVATYCGQNRGAGQMERIKKGVRNSMIVSAVCSVFAALFVILLAKPLTRLFITDPTVEMLDLSLEYLFWQGVFYVLLGAIYVYRNALQGMGYSALTMFAGLTELGMRAIAAFVFAKLWGYIGICLSNPVAWIGADVFLLLTYPIMLRKLMKKYNYPVSNRAFNRMRKDLLYERETLAS